MPRSSTALFLPGALVLLTTGSATATIQDITVGNIFFSPQDTVVQPGDTVRWTWTGGIPHSTTADGSPPKSWDSGVTSTAAFQFLLEFTEADGPGPFPYHCSIHGGMRDTIFVEVPDGSCCLPPTVGDIDQSGGVDITDIAVLIDNQFLTLSPLSACP